MSYKYINPGYYTLFDGWDLSSANPQIIDNYEINPLNGLAIQKALIRYTIPANSTVVYCAFGLYAYGAHTYNVTVPISIYDLQTDTTFLKISFNPGQGICTVTLRENEIFKYYQKFEKNRYNRIMFKMDTTAGSLDIWVNGEQLYSQTGKNAIINIGNLFGKDLVINTRPGDYSISADEPFSNFIISDEEIKPNEDVLVLPKGNIEADVAPNVDGSYTFKEEGQKFLMEAVVTPLKDDDVITGIAALGYPGYNKGDDIYHVEGIDKDASGNITAHGLDAVPSDELAAVGVSYIVNLTKTQLDGYKVGLRMAK